MKKVLVILMTMGIMMFSFSGCGDSGSSSTTTEENGGGDENTTETNTSNLSVTDVFTVGTKWGEYSDDENQTTPSMCMHIVSQSEIELYSPENNETYSMTYELTGTDELKFIMNGEYVGLDYQLGPVISEEKIDMSVSYPDGGTNTGYLQKEECM